jgi:Protein of unknown function (DUF935)
MKIPFTDIDVTFNNLSKPQPQKANVRDTISFEQQLQRVRQDANKFNVALQAAESTMYPNRFLLMQTYQQIILDAQVQSGLLQRKSKVLSQAVVLKNAAGDIDEEKTKLFQSKWFYDFSNLALDAYFWGHSLIQFGPVINDAFEYVELVPRIYVVPEKSLVRQNTATVTDGVYFNEAPYNNWCIGVGGKTNLGIGMYVTPYVIWKKNALASWAEFAEIFGSPIRIGKTDVRDEVTRKNMENMMRNMATAAWAVLDLNDSVDLVQASRTDAFQVFDKMVERCNSEITKLILGQTGTTDEKAYAGSANVQASVADMIAKQDILNMEYIINLQLLPMMNRLGFGLDGYKAEYDNTETLPLSEQIKIDAEIMKKYNLNIEYLEAKYNVEIDDADSAAEGEVVNIAKRLQNLYNV